MPLDLRCDNEPALDTESLRMVQIAMLSMQRASWEQGVAAQAMLELDREELSTHLYTIALCQAAIVRQDAHGRLGVLLNKEDTGALDPASLIHPILAISSSRRLPIHLKSQFESAAKRMIDYLLSSQPPRTAQGILSHRIDKVQLWVDGIWMVAPAFASAAKHWKDPSLLQVALEQMEGYRSALWNPDKQLFSHIWDEASGCFEREAFWGVGNGWAIHGMTRVLLLLPPEMTQPADRLASHIKSALTGVVKHMRSDGLFHDTLDDPSSFIETNVGQQIACSVFQLVAQGFDDFRAYLQFAFKARRAAISKVDSMGLVQGVCGSPDFQTSGTATEGQAFHIMMESAYRDMTVDHHPTEQSS